MIKSSSDGVISVRDATKCFGQKAVLRQLDFDVPRGSVVGLVGVNGAGKTTLIKCMLGLLRLDAGEITLLGEDSWNLSAEAKMRLGYVSQTPQLLAWMRVRHLVNYTAAFYPRWNARHVEELLDLWELDRNARVSTLSEGQAQRLAIVLALGHDPELLVLDEPAASLDPAARRKFLQTVLQLAANGNRTILFSTHITSDLERVADRIAIVRAGRIVFMGELDTLKDRVKRLHVTAERALPSSLALPGTLAETIDGPSAVVSTSEFTPELVEALRRDHQAEVDVEDLNLEDIFLEFHRDG